MGREWDILGFWWCLYFALSLRFGVRFLGWEWVSLGCSPAVGGVGTFAGGGVSQLCLLSGEWLLPWCSFGGRGCREYGAYGSLLWFGFVPRAFGGSAEGVVAEVEVVRNGYKVAGSEPSTPC